MRPNDKERLDLAWARFIQLKRRRIEADRTGSFAKACTLEAEERRAHADIGFTRHKLGLDE